MGTQVVFKQDNVYIYSMIVAYLISHNKHDAGLRLVDKLQALFKARDNSAST